MNLFVLLLFSYSLHPLKAGFPCVGDGFGPGISYFLICGQFIRYEVKVEVVSIWLIFVCQCMCSIKTVSGHKHLNCNPEDESTVIHYNVGSCLESGVI
jgi:hypothetical protein